MTCKVLFKRENIEVEVKAGTTILEAARSVGVSIEAPCNKAGVCGKCKILAVGELSEVKKEEVKFLKEKNERLACFAEVIGDVIVETTDLNDKMKTAGFDLNRYDVFNPLIRTIELINLDKASNKPYIEQLNIKKHSIEFLSILSRVCEKDYKDKKIVKINKKAVDIVDQKKKICGIAIDIGTTGISLETIDLETGQTLNKSSFINPQVKYGADVLSRMTYSMESEENRFKIKKEIIEALNKEIKEIEQSENALIYHVALSANTAMVHLLLGLDVSSMAMSPYRSIKLDKVRCKAIEIGINLEKEGIVDIMPAASSYVGGDIVSGITAIELYNKFKKVLFIDIGTNGEIVMSDKGRLSGTSTAAGPALEGVNISCGMRAEKGAIESIEIKKGEIKTSVIGKESPKGICGSGIIDVMAELVKNKIVMKTGRFSNKLSDELKQRLEDKKFKITEDISITQGDIRQIQLAKGAISTGIKMLLNKKNIEISEIDEIVIAGSFGYHLKEDSIKVINLIPKEFDKKISFVGNTSLEGARASILDKKFLKKAQEVANEIEVLELSRCENFEKVFVRELNF